MVLDNEMMERTMYNRTREGSNSAKLAGQARRKGDKMATGLH